MKKICAGFILTISLISNIYGFNEELAKSDSPYIQKYVDSDINWREYSNLIFKQAKKEKKLIFISIGNNNCKWCDRQDEDVFSDEDAAKLLNLYYISVKIDEEQTPNVAKKYSDILKITTGSEVDLPLNIILDSEGNIIYIKNYIPLDGKDGILNLLTKISRKMDYKEFREKVVKNNKKIQELLNEKINTKEHRNIKTSRLVSSFVSNIKNTFDTSLGGFKNTKGKKYIYEPIIITSIDIYKENKKNKIKWILEETVNAIIGKGIRDQVDGGFFDYTIDRYWTKPVFQKNIKTQAEALSAISSFYDLEKDTDYIEAVNQTFEFLQKYLYSKDTGLYFTKIMDKRIYKKDKKIEKGEEEFSGKYYLFHKEVVGEKANFNEEYVYMDRRLAQTERERLKRIRKKKELPQIDKRIFFSENAFLVSGFIHSSIINEKYKKKGLILLDKLIDIYKKKNGKILHLINSNKDSEVYSLEDYSYFINSLLVAYENTFNKKYFELAQKVIEETEKLFKINGIWYLSNDDLKTKAQLISKIYRSSPLSIMFSNYNKMFYFSLNDKFKKEKENLLNGYYIDIMYNPMNYSLVIDELAKNLYHKFILVSNRKNILKLKNIYGEKYFYSVDEKLSDIIALKKNKSQKIKAKNIEDFQRKERNVIEKIKDDKFILFID